MPTIFIQPHASAQSRLSTSLSGSESLEFNAVLDAKMRIKFFGTNDDFPRQGRVVVQRGFSVNEAGARILDEFRFLEGYTDDDPDESVSEHFRAHLHLEEGAYDRIVQRLNFGLPTIALHFSLSSKVISPINGGSSWDLRFKYGDKTWEQVEGATLFQSEVGLGVVEHGH